MAKQPKKKTSKAKSSSKKPVSFKEHSKLEREKAKQPRRLKSKTKQVKKPIGGIQKFIRKVLGPFSFLLWPFKQEPVKKVLRFFGKILFINYIIASFKEVQQVTWPNRKETIKLTTAVILFAIVFAAIVAGADWVIDKTLREIII